MKSGLYFPNELVRITLQSLEEVVGSSGMKSLYNLSGSPELFSQLPPQDMQKEFDFADFSVLFSTLGTLFGKHGARSLTLRAGKSAMREGYKAYGSQVTEVSPFTSLSNVEELITGFHRFITFLNSISDLKLSMIELQDAAGIEIIIQNCPVCWGQTVSEPICSFFEGMLVYAAEIYSRTTDFIVTETICTAAGGDGCHFSIRLPEKAANEISGNVQEPL
jgi:predicted hydrocarbon binding protein